MKTLIDFKFELHAIQEELTPEQKQQVDAWPETKKRNISFSDHVFGGPDNHRLTIPLESHKTEVPDAVRSHLEQHGMKIDNDSYEQGHAIDKYNRPVRIGAALEKTKAPDHVKQAFTADPQRALKDKNSKLQVVITRHQHDVAGMTSRGHSWPTSCMNYETGINRHYLPKDVEHGTHIAYLTNKGDDEAKNPLARIALKPYHSTDTETPHTIVRPENKTYGANTTAFDNTVKNFTDKHFPAKADLYAKNPNTYDDTGNRVVVGDVGKALNNSDSYIRKLAISQHNAKPEHITKALGDSDRYVREMAISHHNVTPEHITQALNLPGYENRDVRRAAIGNPKATSEHVTQALKDSDSNVISAALKHKNAKPEHITQALNLKGESSKYARAAAAANPSASPANISKALKDESLHVRRAALENPSATAEHITQALKLPREGNLSLIKTAVEHPAATSEHLTKALRMDNEDISDSVMSNPNAAPEHLTHILNKTGHKYAKVAGLSNVNITPTTAHITKALSDPHESVRRAALDTKNVNASHIGTALTDQSSTIRLVAAGHPAATKAHLHTAIDDNELNVARKALQHENIDASHISRALERAHASNYHHPLALSAIQHTKVTPAHITKALTMVSPEYNDTRYTAISHPSVNKEHLSTAINDHNPIIVEKAAKNPNLTADHISSILKIPEGFTPAKMAAVAHKNATPNHITQALQDQDFKVRKAATKNPNLSAEHISTALADKSAGVRASAIKHPNVTTRHINTALKMTGDQHAEARAAAAASPLASESHITQAMNDQHPMVRFAAASNPNATHAHITKALGDEDHAVAWKATQHPNASREHLETASKMYPNTHVADAANDRLKTMAKTQKKVKA